MPAGERQPQGGASGGENGPQAEGDASVQRSTDRSADLALASSGVPFHEPGGSAITSGSAISPGQRSDPGGSRAPSRPGRAAFDAGELAKVCSRYDIGAIESVKEFRRGSGRAPKVLIRTDRGKFLLKRRAVGKDTPERVAFTHEIQTRLARKRFPLPRLVPTRDDLAVGGGKTMLLVDNQVYELFEYVDGSSYDHSLDATADAGRALGFFHRILERLDAPAVVPRGASYHNARGVEQHLTMAARRLTPSDADLAATLRDVYHRAAEAAEAAGVSSWPLQVVHGDWHPGNMLFKGSRVLAVIDYDTARLCPRVIDIANGLLQFSITMQGADPLAWPTGLDAGRFKRFLRGYETVPDSVVSTAEIQAIPWLMIEALIVEAVVPIAATGSFAGLSGSAFLQMVRGKTDWLVQNAERLSAVLAR